MTASSQFLTPERIGYDIDSEFEQSENEQCLHNMTFEADNDDDRYLFIIARRVSICQYVRCQNVVGYQYDVC